MYGKIIQFQSLLIGNPGRNTLSDGCFSKKNQSVLQIWIILKLEVTSCFSSVSFSTPPSELFGIRF